MVDSAQTEARGVRDIVSNFGNKCLFEYIPEMEINVPDSDRKNSMDKIAYYCQHSEVVLSDLFIGYAISLYRFTIPKIVAETIQVFATPLAGKKCS